MDIKAEILKIVSNRRKHDKSSLAYILKYIDHHKYMYYESTYTRDYILSCLDKELDKPVNIEKVLKFNGFKHLKQ